MRAASTSGGERRWKAANGGGGREGGGGTNCGSCSSWHHPVHPIVSSGAVALDSFEDASLFNSEGNAWVACVCIAVDVVVGRATRQAVKQFPIV